MTQAPAIYNTF